MVNPMANLLGACEMLSLNYLNLKKDALAEGKHNYSLKQAKTFNQPDEAETLIEAMARMEENIVKELNSQLSSVKSSFFEMDIWIIRIYR